MVEFDAFREELATALLRCAERRRPSHAGATVTGEDIKVVALLKRLADDVKNLDLHVFLIFELMFTHARHARRSLERREDLLAQIGVLYCPSSATELVRWLTRQTMEDARQDCPPGSCRRSSALVLPSPDRTPRSRRDPSDTKHQGLFRCWASDFSAGVGIVAPMLSIWNVRLGLNQMHDRSVIADHGAVPATVVSVAPLSGGKSSDSASDVVLSFRQSSGETCHMTWHSALPAFAGSPGDTLAVVPRSSACALPLIPSRIGDPTQTFALAAALMAGGLASIKLWSWLFRHSPDPVPRRRLLTISGRQRHDLV